MANETSLIMKRRFFGRILESGLLIIAVALGIGAAASGLSLMFHTKEYSQNLLKSPTYKEVVVSTRANADDMEFPAVEKNDNRTTLTSKDLQKGELIDDILYSYIISNSFIRLLTEDQLENGNNQNFGPPPGNDGGQEPRADNTQNNSNQQNNNPDNRNNQQNRENQRLQITETFKSVKDDPNYLITEVEDMQGVEVTTQFFTAWDISTSEGSLFATSDYTSNKNIILLGSELSELLNTQGYESIIGKKIMSWDTIYTIVGVLEPTDSRYDTMFITPKKELSNNNFTRRFGNSQLRFYVDNVNELNDVTSQLQELFNKEYGEGQVEISNPRQEATRVVNRNSGISLLILFLSLAGLFIASVNVSNILMSRSLRMRKHVGILKALGASKNKILLMFAKEALFITIAGAILGVCLAIPLSKTMEESLGLGDVSWLYIFVGVLLSTILTLLFSVLPARQSSAIDPAEAMR